ncbi:hypothetical protein MRS44_017987 [Fusarium solani]|uniref:uncharacterized protein n=1 Tax=Fusarium solani TaxID=169388 RepID=UPI0032C49282|nr:hypothetical protein MRS44_017987 [Fusarium solani]
MVGRSAEGSGGSDDGELWGRQRNAGPKRLHVRSRDAGRRQSQRPPGLEGYQRSRLYGLGRRLRQSLPGSPYHGRYGTPLRAAGGDRARGANDERAPPRWHAGWDDSTHANDDEDRVPEEATMARAGCHA